MSAAGFFTYYFSMEAQMFETLDKIMLAGLGALSMTRERAEKIFDEYADKGREQRGDKPGFVKELMDTAEKSRKDLEKLVSDQVHTVLSKINLANADDIKRLEKKIDQILKQKKG